MQKDWTENTVSIRDNIELFYLRTGGNKPPIILAHGITDNASCWELFATDLQEDYDLIMYDAYGHGKSSRIDPNKPFDNVKDLHDLIKTLKLNKPGLIGHSMGAATAAGFAAAYPDSLSALVLEDPPWSDQKLSMSKKNDTLQEWKKGNLAAKDKTVKELVKLKKKESPKWDEAMLEDWAKAKHAVDPAIYDRYPKQKIDWREIASAITVPTLIIAGDTEQGAIVTQALGVEALSVIQNCEFGHISGAGHCVRYDQRKPYLTMVKLFLQRNMSGK